MAKTHVKKSTWHQRESIQHSLASLSSPLPFGYGSLLLQMSYFDEVYPKSCCLGFQCSHENCSDLFLTEIVAIDAFCFEEHEGNTSQPAHFRINLSSVCKKARYLSSPSYLLCSPKITSHNEGAFSELQYVTNLTFKCRN